MGQIFSTFIFMGLKRLKGFEMSPKDWEQVQPSHEEDKASYSESAVGHTDRCMLLSSSAP